MKRISAILTVLVSFSLVSLIFQGCISSEYSDEETYEEGSYYDLVEVNFDDVVGEASLKKNFFFVFDGSGSMDEECSGQKKITGAKAAINAFLEKIPDDVHLGLVVFDNYGENMDFYEANALDSNNRGVFKDNINEVVAGGGTPLADAMIYATDQLIEQYKKQLGYGDYRLIVVTDGIAEDIPYASEYATDYGVSIYAIGLCLEGSHPLRDYAFSYREATNYEDLERALEDAVAEPESYDVSEFTTLEE